MRRHSCFTPGTQVSHPDVLTSSLLASRALSNQRGSFSSPDDELARDEAQGLVEDTHFSKQPIKRIPSVTMAPPCDVPVGVITGADVLKLLKHGEFIEARRLPRKIQTARGRAAPPGSSVREVYHRISRISDSTRTIN